MSQCIDQSGQMSGAAKLGYCGGVVGAFDTQTPCFSALQKQYSASPHVVYNHAVSSQPSGRHSHDLMAYEIKQLYELLPPVYVECYTVPPLAKIPMHGLSGSM